MSENTVRVLSPKRLREVRAIDGDAVVLDATSSTTPLPLLARLVRLRRALRATGGELMVVAGPETEQLLHRSGLHRSLPYRGDVASAVAAVRDAPNQHLRARPVS